MVGKLVDISTLRRTVVALGLASVAAHAQSESPVARTREPHDIMTATASHPAVQRVTVDADNTPLTTVLQEIARQAGLNPAYNEAMLPTRLRITLHLRQVPVTDAFSQTLRGTGLIAQVRLSGDVTIVRDVNAITTGTIIGRVMDAKTKQPIHGAKVALDALTRGVETSDNGTYRIANVPAGSHTITVKMIGYTKMVQRLLVPDTGTVAVDISLQTSATALDQVVVTGTVIPMELKGVPNAMTVITAKDIEQRGVTRIDQLFRGDVPGLFARNSGSGNTLDQVSMFSRGGSAMPLSNTSSTAATNPIKTYVDGVELADPSYLNQIDPRSIERIEILTGPQASTIYGSNAINGVMQIFTKRGTRTRPEITVNLLSGVVQNNYSNALTPQHDYSGQILGTEGRWSYNVGGSWNYIGPWTPAKQTARTDGYGGGRMQYGSFTVDGSARHSETRTRAKGSPRNGSDNQAYFAGASTGLYTAYGSGSAAPNSSSANGQTFGGTLSFAPTSWWSHELVVGSDVTNTEALQSIPGYIGNGSNDTLLYLSQQHTGKTSQRYSTTVQGVVAEVVRTTITVGFDHWRTDASGLSASPDVFSGSLNGPTITRTPPSKNTGGFVQGQLGMWDALFLTYGLRAEWNPSYGDDAQPNLSPRYGIAYTREFGFITAKVRASYGRSTRPPTLTEKSAIKGADYYGSFYNTYYGPINVQDPNPDLGPEFQQGGEGGFELYLGNRASLVVTRYNQTVDGLITNPEIDSVAPIVADYPYYAIIRQNLNIGSIRNQGWELQGSVNTGALTTKGTYSWTKSRFLGITPKYRAQFPASQYLQYQPGASFTYLPEHTWGVNFTYALPSTTVSLDINGTGALYNGGDDLYFIVQSARLDVSRARKVLPTTYRSTGSGYAMADLNATHRVSSMIDGVLQVQNLSNFYQNDMNVYDAAIGRQTKVGLRIRW